MNEFKSFTAREKVKYIAILLQYPFRMLFKAVEKTIRFFTKQKQIIALILTACMLISMISPEVINVYAAVSNPGGLSNPILGTSIDILPVGSVASVYLGQYPQDTTEPNDFQPIKWSVVLKNVNELGKLESTDPKANYFPQFSSGAVTLISEKILDTCDFMDFKSSWTYENYLWHLPYSRSKLHQFLDGPFKIKAFSEVEMDALSDANVLVWGGSYYGTLDYATESVNAKVFAPDFYIQGYADMKGLLTINEAAEVTAYAAAQKWSSGYLDKKAYWLRTVPCYSPLMPCDQGISMNDRFQIRDSGAQTRALTVGVRPMTRVLDKNVILVSQVGAKDSASVYNHNLTGEKEYKFTLYDDTRIFKATPTGDVIYGEHSATVNLSYSGAKVGANEYISYIVTDEYDRIYKYERLKTVTSPSGTISIEIDYEDFGNNNDCELRVFNEQINSGCYTDYASSYSTVEICRDPSYHLNVWIDGTRLNWDNAKNFGYDPYTNTLTITRPWYQMDYYEKDRICYGIYVEGDLNINFNPEVTLADYELVSSGATGLSQTAIYVSGDLNMTSNLPGRELYIDNGVTGRMPTMTGIECGGKLTVSNMTLDIDTGNAVGMYAIKAKSIELYNATIIAHTAYDLDDRQNASSSLYRSYVISCESYYQMGGSVEIYPIYNDYGDYGLELLGEGNFELDGKATLIFDGEVDYHFGWGKTIEEVVANKDITVTTEGNKKVLKANSCSKHEISYRTNSSKVYEECLYCKEIFGLMRILAPANLYYDGTPKYVRIYGQLPSNPEITITYYNYDTKKYGDPVKIGGYTAYYTVGSEKGFIQFKIIENTTGEAPKTDFEELQEQINAGGSIWVGYVAAESTDKPLIIPENVEVNLLLAESVIDRSEALEPGPVFDVRGTLKLVGHSLVNSDISSVITGGTDSGIIVRPGGTLILANIYNFEITGNTSNGPGAGIYCAGTIIEEGDPRIYGNMSNGKESGIHLADGSQLIYKDHLYGVLGDFEDLRNTVAITRDDMTKPIAVADGTSASIIENIARRHVSGYDHLTTFLNKTTGELYLIPKGMNYIPGTYIDHYTSEEKGIQTINLRDFNNQSTLDLVSTSKDGSFGYVQVKEGSSNKNVQLSFTTFAISMVVPANTTCEVKHDFALTMDRNSSGSLGYYGEIFYLGDDPNKDLTFTRGDTKTLSSGSSGKAYSTNKNGYTQTIPVTATYKNDSCKEQTITQWFGFYAGLGKADTYKHQAQFEMELAKPGVVVSATSSPVTHTYDDNYKSDNEKHWRFCSICGSQGDIGEHAYDNDCDTTCNVCGAERAVTHNWQTEWSSDGTNHWYECSICHEKKDEAAHTPEVDDGDCTTAVHCSVCGAETTPAQSHDFNGDWFHDNEGHWQECIHSGCTVTDTKESHVWTEGTPNPEPTYFADGQRIDTCACGETKTIVLPKIVDSIVPTGDIKIGTSSVRKVLNVITFGLFFKDTQKVTITSSDEESGVKSTQYYLSTEILDENAIKNISSWIDYSGKILLNPNDKYVVYVKITDNQNNITYLGSEGITIDSAAPVILGVVNGETYCISAEFAVTEENLDTVKVNGTKITLVDGKYTLTTPGENEVVVTDKAGNSTNITVTINAVHTYDNDIDIDCNVCGAVRSIAHTHSWQANWSSDSAKHWHECSICHERMDEGTHTYDNDSDIDCNVCGAVRSIVHIHSWQVNWSSDAVNHWHECSVCHERKDEAAHTYDDDSDTNCNVCGAERTIVHTHDWQTEWSSDVTSHWHECSVCHERNEEAPHLYDNESDKTCHICGYTREIGCIEHTYDNNCDDTCNVCGAVRIITHSWQTNWSSDGTSHWHECFICHLIKNRALHTYDNDCDADCNVCGETRAITHNWQTSWSSDGTNHWHECSVCHTIKDKAAHTPELDDHDCTTAVHCSVCGTELIPAQSHDFNGNWLHDGDGHWHECIHTGCTVSDTKLTHNWIEGIPDPEATYFMDGQRIDTCACGETNSVVLPKLVDSSVPTGTITVGKNSWNSFLNDITFGLFFKDTQYVTVTSEDRESGVDKTYYYLSHKKLSETEAKGITAWTEFKDSFSINPNNEYVVYVKITDKVGNSSIINTEGVVLDNIIPAISGVTDGKNYCTAVTVTVIDDNLDTVKLDGKVIRLADGKFTVSPADKAQRITATDKAGNITTVTIKVYDGHAWNEGVVIDEPTTSKNGAGTYTCTHCGETKTEEIPMLVPSIIEGQNGNWEPDVGGTLTFRSNADFRDFIGVLVDDKEVDEKYYEAKEGSIIITLKADYLATLSAGTHRIDIQSTTGTASAEFTIKAKEDDKTPSKSGETESVQKGDNSSMLLWIALLFVLGSTLTLFRIKSKKKKDSKIV